MLNAAVLARHAGSSETPSRSPSDSVLKCVSLNLLQGNSDYKAVEAFLRSSGADVVVLQEVTPKWAVALKRLGDIYPAQFIKAKKDSKGTAILTRLNATRLYFDPFPRDAQVGALVGELETPAGEITVVGVHSHKPTSAEGAEAQVSYFKWLAERTTHDSVPVILMGDFNATPWSQAIQAFTSTSPLLNAGRGAIFDATWNRGRPNQLLIDHAFISRHWQVVKREVGPAVGSDHRPLVIDLALAL